MKSPITSANRGFLISEIMIAFALVIMLLTSAVILSSTMSELRQSAEKKLGRMDWLSSNISSTTIYTTELYGNDSVISKVEPIAIVRSDFDAGWGRETCDPRLQYDPAKISVITQKTDLGGGNASTDIEVRNGFAYLTVDSSVAGLPDLYIFDFRNPVQPVLVSSLNTGPGLSSLEVAGPFIYAANLGTTNQLQVIDISERSVPKIVAKTKITAAAGFIHTTICNCNFL
jgi:hypothetical protein